MFSGKNKSLITALSAASRQFNYHHFKCFSCKALVPLKAGWFVNNKIPYNIPTNVRCNSNQIRQQHPTQQQWISKNGFHTVPAYCDSYSSSDINSEVLLQKSLTSKYSSLSSTSGLNNDNYLRCTLFNSRGNLHRLSVDIKRKDLILKYKLMPRDIRKINYKPTLQVNSVPYISVRNDSILVNLLHIRALIKNDSVILFDTPGIMMPHERQFFINELSTKLKQKDSESGLPYEMRALEAIFMSVTQSLNQEIKVQKDVIKSILVDLETHIHTENLKLLLDQNKKITAFYQKAKLIRDAIDDILKQDDLLAELYLTNPTNDVENHAEVEILLETYYKHFDEAVQIVEEIINNIKTTQEIINIILDANRNQLMLLGLRFSIGILFLGCGIYVASIYGMNLENFIEEENYGFALVVGATILVLALFFARSIKMMHKLEKIAVSGNKSMPTHRHSH